MINWRSILDCRSEIVNLAIADFKQQFPNALLLPDAESSDIYGGDKVLLSKDLDPIATYDLEIDRTDFLGRVELHFVSDDRCK
jgi:hypothetical protein